MAQWLMRSRMISAARRHAAWIVLPLAALLATLPLILQGCSCGHDFDFHIQSWLDAAQQMRHGTLDPQWAASAAWNAGEPRFIFYPPLSWMLGALLTLLFPIAAAPALFTWTALTLAALTMFRCVREFASPRIALVAAALYATNPYTLFTAFERTAYAELLAAAWMPLLVLAALRPRTSVRSIAIPLALLWLTNAPAAVIGTYGFVLLFILRVIFSMKNNEAREHRTRDVVVAAAGILLGLALPAFYLIPAAWERRYVQIAMAIIPGMRVEDNFLFGRTADAAHNAVLHTASLIAVTLLAATAVALVAAFFFRRNEPHNPALVTPHSHPAPASALAITLLLLAALLTPLSLPLWHHLPELAFLQFPWRILSLLAVVLALSIALALRRAPLRPAVSAALALIIATTLSLFAIHTFRQGCDTSDLPATRAQLFATHHGVPPTDEYTPAHADNDALRPDDPAYWLAPDPNAPAPNTTPNPAAADPNFDPADFTDAQTLSTPAPHHLALHLDAPAHLILNLRDYPAWRITRSGSPIAAEPVRDDGLIALALPAGDSTIDIAWHSGRDRTLGIAVSLLALLVLLAAPRVAAALR